MDRSEEQPGLYVRLLVCRESGARPFHLHV